MVKRFLALVLATHAFGIGQIAFAEQQSETSPLAQKIEQMFIDNLSLSASISRSAEAGATSEEIQTYYLTRFRELDNDGVPGISETDSDIIVKKSFAQQRSGKVGNMLSRDLNGDQKVTEKELRTALFYQVRAALRIRNEGVEPTLEQIEVQLSKNVEAVLQDDLDGNRILTVKDVYQRYELNYARYEEYRDVREKYPYFPSISLDINDDHTVSQTEYIAFIQLTLTTIDVNGDGTVTQDEHSNFIDMLQDLLDARAD